MIKIGTEREQSLILAKCLLLRHWRVDMGAQLRFYAYN